MKVVVIGFGWVGQANALALSMMGEDVYYFDPQNPDFHYKESYAKYYNNLKALKNPLEVDSDDTVYLVCVGDKVLPSGDQDLTNIKKALDSLAKANGTVILRSTILPSSLKDLKFDFYVPEFLHEIKAVEECSKPHYFVIGDRKTKPVPVFLQKWSKASYKIFEGTPEEASYIKYLSNIWNSLRIAFVNEFGNAIKIPRNHRDVKSIEKIIDFIFGGKSYLRYGRGFGGHCLPKDTLAFWGVASKNNSGDKLFKAIIDSNDIHIEMHKNNDVVKEWFSEWEKSDVSGKIALRALVKAIGRNLKYIVTGKKEI